MVKIAVFKFFKKLGGPIKFVSKRSKLVCSTDYLEIRMGYKSRTLHWTINLEVPYFCSDFVLLDAWGTL